jgi:hypothetical protein
MGFHCFEKALGLGDDENAELQGRSSNHTLEMVAKGECTLNYSSWLDNCWSNMHQWQTLIMIGLLSCYPIRNHISAW